jgi:hypothetical protein
MKSDWILFTPSLLRVTFSPAFLNGFGWGNDCTERQLDLLVSPREHPF